jgi:hypothetical protein
VDYGCHYHPRFQQIAFVNTEGGECGGTRLQHVQEAEQFYRSLQGQAVRVGMEASGHARWLERLLAELGYELSPVNHWGVVDPRLCEWVPCLPRQRGSLKS